MYDLIVLGGGPAGLTATVYAIRKRLNVLLITRDLGGKTNYRLQLPFVEKRAPSLSCLRITSSSVLQL